MLEQEFTKSGLSIKVVYDYYYYKYPTEAIVGTYIKWDDADPDEEYKFTILFSSNYKNQAVFTYTPAGQYYSISNEYQNNYIPLTMDNGTYLNFLGTSLTRISVVITSKSGGKRGFDIDNVSFYFPDQNSNILIDGLVNGKATIAEEIEIRPVIPYSAELLISTYTLAWRCNGMSGIIIKDATISESQNSIIKWTPPAEIAETVLSSDEFDVKLVLDRTYKESTTNYAERTIICIVPGPSEPRIAEISIDDYMEHIEKYGSYIQGVSSINVNVTAYGTFGSGITSVLVYYGDNYYESKYNVPINIKLINSGNIRLNVRVTDARQRIAEGYVTVYAQEYDRPIVKIDSLFRCDANGIYKDDGNYSMVVFSDNVSPVGNTNVVQRKVLRRIYGATQWEYYGVSDLSGNVYSTSKYGYIQDVSAQEDYEYCVEVSDKFVTIRSVYKRLPVTFALVDIDKSHKKFGIGKRASGDIRTSDVIEIGLDVRMFGKKITDVAEPSLDSDVVTLGFLKNAVNMMFPVGSLFTSMDSQCSAKDLLESFGIDSVWTKIEGKFIFGANDKYYSGATGGEETVALSIENLPQHSHSTRTNVTGSLIDPLAQGSSSGQGIDTITVTGGIAQTGVVGEGEGHNNMPPFIAANIWKRVS